MLKRLKLSLFLVLLLTSCQKQIDYATERAAHHAAREVDALIDKKLAQLNVGSGASTPNVPGWKDDAVYWIGGLVTLGLGGYGRHRLVKRRRLNGNRQMDRNLR